MDTSKILEEAAPNIYHLNIGGLDIHIADSIIVMWIVMFFIILFGYILTRNLKPVPEGKQNTAEIIVESINNLMKQNIGHHWRPFAPYLGTVLIFLIAANTVSLFNFIPSSEFFHHYHLNFLSNFHFRIAPPTKDVNITAALAIMSIVLVLGAGIVIKRPIGFLKSLFQPIFIVFPFKILDFATRPLSLCMRLFGNIFAAYILMELIYMVAPVIIPAALSVYFDLFDGGLQAIIFVFLTSLYIAESVE